MTFTEAKIELKKKVFFLKARLVITVFWLLAVVLYLPPLIKGKLDPISFHDISELKFIQIHYSISPWLDPIFILVWLIFIAIFVWFLQKKRLILADQKLNFKNETGGKDREARAKEFEDESLVLDAYILCFVLGGLVVGLWAAIDFGAAFYGVIAHALFTLYLHVFIMTLIIVWSVILPVQQFVVKKFRHKSL